MCSNHEAFILFKQTMHIREQWTAPIRGPEKSGSFFQRVPMANPLGKKRTKDSDSNPILPEPGR